MSEATTRPMDRLLVANRGEIARRIFATCRRMGIGTAAVYADPDANAPYVAEADVAVRLPGAKPADTYLRIDRIVDAAKAAGADAVHPGYGFLSENAEFARAVVDAGLTWVGPPSDVIASMGSKTTAKQRMAAAGVPVLSALDPENVTASDLPVVIKAAAGGGGRGMRIVRDVAALPHQLDAARAEARSAFGDDTVFCEPYLSGARHVEVQILADHQGVVWAVGDRECSLQRRHQKVIEEAPSPAVDAALRAELCATAVAAAKAVGYVGAGTVEFLVTADGRFWFLEMNTRLQVEHTVSECVTGLDLVMWQLRIASGARLPKDVESPAPVTGHAVEARLYAETVTVTGGVAEWQPRTGTLHRFAIPMVDRQFAVPALGTLRLDSGVVDGDAVSVHYDPLLAKVIVRGETRQEAIRCLADALAKAHVHGVATNRDLLVRLLRHPAFVAGDVDTGFLDRHVATVAAPLADDRAVRLSALAAALADAARNRATAPVLGRVPSGWRNVPSQPQRKSYQADDGQVDVAYRITRDGLVADAYDDVRLVSSTPDCVVMDVGGVTYRFTVAAYPELVCVDSALGPVSLRPVPRFTEPADEVAAGSLLAPMPGTVTAVHVSEGDRVPAGATLVVIEAMKMQHPVTTTVDGVVTAVPVTVGSTVDTKTVLAVVTATGGG